MKLGTSANYPWFGPRFADLARHTEQLGFESLWTGEHIIIPVHIADPQRYGVPLPENYKHMPDVFGLMAAGATATTKLVFGMDICLISQRNPLILAKQAATLDHLSGGRFILGVGHGWIEEESEIMGAPFKDRVKIAKETVEALKALWTQKQASFQGAFVSFPPVYCYPKPLQKPHVPILIGAGNDATNNSRALKRVVETANGWLPSMLSPQQARDQIADLRGLCEAAGRDFKSLDVTLIVPAAYMNIGERPPWAGDMTLGDAKDLLPQYTAAGVTRLIVGLDDMTDDKSFARLEEAAKALGLA